MRIRLLDFCVGLDNSINAATLFEIISFFGEDLSKGRQSHAGNSITLMSGEKNSIPAIVVAIRLSSFRTNIADPLDLTKSDKINNSREKNIAIT